MRCCMAWRISSCCCALSAEFADAEASRPASCALAAAAPACSGLNASGNGVAVNALKVLTTGTAGVSENSKCRSKFRACATKTGVDYCNELKDPSHDSSSHHRCPILTFACEHVWFLYLRHHFRLMLQALMALLASLRRSTWPRKENAAACQRSRNAIGDANGGAAKCAIGA